MENRRLFILFWSSLLVKKPPREAGSQHSQHYAVASHLWLVEEMRQCHICPETSLLKPAVKWNEQGWDQDSLETAHRSKEGKLSW